MNTLQAYRFALDPNNTQRADLHRHAGAARFVFNWGLARVKAALSQREAEQTYGLTGDMLTPVPWTLPALRLEWNKAKSSVAPWWAECSKEAFSAGLDRLARGLKNFTDSRKGKRKGRRVGFPPVQEAWEGPRLVPLQHRLLRPGRGPACEAAPDRPGEGQRGDGRVDRPACWWRGPAVGCDRVEGGGPVVRVVHGAGRPGGSHRPVGATAHSRAGRCRPRGEASRCALHWRDGAEPEASDRVAAPAAHRIAGLRPVETR
ncbi:hypothetical protein FMEAI12_4930025 [Parafrankia sp. Ea1.12]|nr:hypothetical protein FMEAI12_4930025 [Parafrankia sp. Ea1.12]